VDAVFENLSVTNYADRYFIPVNLYPIWMIIDVPDLYFKVEAISQLINSSLCYITQVAILAGVEDQFGHLTMLA
ncbi:uncharacterized protein METZ01_LOCUS155256, partial [marine metagenome]|tara:strand:- start:1129 stop:1350 length:222 start_codon:yes stop_codon:yes gene_type:complete